MRILIYNQNITELDKMSKEVIEALENEKAMIDVSYSFLKNKKKLNHVIYDIAIIDLSAGKEDALFLSRHLRYHNEKCMIVLLGNDYKESIFAFDIKAAMFLLKEDCNLKRELKKVIVSYKKSNPWIYFNKDDKKYKIYLENIIYVEVASKSITLVCRDQKYVSLRKENKDILEVLLKYGFVQVHQSYYISFKYIASFKKGEVTFLNGDNVSVSLKYTKSFHEKLNVFMDNFG